MGNYKFRLSGIMPNAWFYKLKEMGRTRNHNNVATSHPIKKKQAPTTKSSVATAAAAVNDQVL